MRKITILDGRTPDGNQVAEVFGEPGDVSDDEHRRNMAVVRLGFEAKYPGITDIREWGYEQVTPEERYVLPGGNSARWTPGLGVTW